MSSSQPLTMASLTAHDLTFLYGSALVIITRFSQHPLHWQSSLLLFGSETMQDVSIACHESQTYEIAHEEEIYCYLSSICLPSVFFFGQK